MYTPKSPMVICGIRMRPQHQALWKQFHIPTYIYASMYAQYTRKCILPSHLWSMHAQYLRKRMLMHPSMHDIHVNVYSQVTYGHWWDKYEAATSGVLKTGRRDPAAMNSDLRRDSGWIQSPLCRGTRGIAPGSVCVCVCVCSCACVCHVVE